MKRYLLKGLLVSFVALGLEASTQKTIVAKLECKKAQLFVSVDSNKLDLTDDALQDNIGGYVDIPATKYYIKSKEKLYYLDGVVSKDYSRDMNQFVSNINGLSKYISKEELQKIKAQKLKFIQKIDLEKNNTNIKVKNITTTNIVYISFDKTQFEKSYEMCK